MTLNTFICMTKKHEILKSRMGGGVEVQLSARPVIPNHCYGDHKCSLSSLEMLPEKVKNLNMLCLTVKFTSKYEGFSIKIIIRCSAKLKRLGNTEPD